jgi:hypothetical protein
MVQAGFDVEQLTSPVQERFGPGEAQHSPGQKHRESGRVVQREPRQQPAQQKGSSFATCCRLVLNDIARTVDPSGRGKFKVPAQLFRGAAAMGPATALFMLQKALSWKSLRGVGYAAAVRLAHSTYVEWYNHRRDKTLARFWRYVRNGISDLTRWERTKGNTQLPECCRNRLDSLAGIVSRTRKYPGVAKRLRRIAAQSPAKAESLARGGTLGSLIGIGGFRWGSLKGIGERVAFELQEGANGETNNHMRGSRSGVEKTLYDLWSHLSSEMYSLWKYESTPKR